MHRFSFTFAFKAIEPIIAFIIAKLAHTVIIIVWARPNLILHGVLPYYPSEPRTASFRFLGQSSSCMRRNSYVLAYV